MFSTIFWPSQIFTGQIRHTNERHIALMHRGRKITIWVPKIHRNNLLLLTFNLKKKQFRKCSPFLRDNSSQWMHNERTLADCCLFSVQSKLICCKDKKEKRLTWRSSPKFRHSLQSEALMRTQPGGGQESDVDEDVLIYKRTRRQTPWLTAHFLSSAAL